MTEAPERILAIKLAGASRVAFLGGDTSPPFDTTEYVRADKVQALVDASGELLRLVDATVEYHDGPGPEYGEEDRWDMGEWFSDVDRHVIDVTRTALAAFTEAQGPK
jgi:hypothetical protein